MDDKPERQAAHQFARPAWPYLNDERVRNAYGQPISQADYDALLAERDRLLRLRQAYGLMADG